MPSLLPHPNRYMIHHIWRMPISLLLGTVLTLVLALTTSAGRIEVPNPSYFRNGTSEQSLGFTVYFGGINYTSVTASVSGFVALGSGFESVSLYGPRFPVLNKPAGVWTYIWAPPSDCIYGQRIIAHGASAAGSSEVDALIASKSPGFTSVGYYVATYRVSYYGTCDMLAFQIILTVDASGNTWAVIQTSEKSLGFTVYFGGMNYTSVTASTNGFVALGNGFGSGCCDGPQFPVLNKPAIAAVWTNIWVTPYFCSNQQSISHGASAVGSSEVDALIANDSPGFTSVGYYVATYRVSYSATCNLLTFQIILTADASGNTWAVIQYEGLSAYRALRGRNKMVAGINDGQGQCSTIYYGNPSTEAMSNLAYKTYVLDMGLCGGPTCSDDLCYIPPHADFIDVPNPSSFSKINSTTSGKSLGFTVYFGGVRYTSVTASVNGFVALGSGFGSGCCLGPQFPVLNQPAIAAV
eukprot:gene21915-28959_t